jgi:uncharacterized protein YqeY
MNTGVRERLQAGLLTAMKRKDDAAVKAYRGALAAVANAEAVTQVVAAPAAGPIAGAVRGLGAGEAPRRVLSERDVLGIVDAEIEDRIATARQYDSLGQTGAADELRAQAQVLRSALGASAPRLSTTPEHHA